MAETDKKKFHHELRKAISGLFVIIGGLGLAFITLWAQWTGNPRLAGAAAVASLIFVVLILLFVVPPLARSASREVAQIDLPLEITAGGLIFLGVIAIVAFAAWNTGNNLLFLVLSFLLATLVVSLILGGANLKKLEARVRIPDAIFAEEPTVFTVAVKNRKFLLPTFSVTLNLRSAISDDPFGGRKFTFARPPQFLAPLFRLPMVRRTIGYFIYIPRRREVEQQTEQLFPHRGQFIIKYFELATRFPFGFWRQTRRLQVKEAVVFIFPKLENVRQSLQSLVPNIGNYVTGRRGTGQDLLGLREYQTADDVRRVDWKATARTGQIIVRDFASEDERRVTICLKTQDSKTDEKFKERFENGVKLTGSLVLHFLDERNEVRLVIDETVGEFGLGRGHLYDCLRRLAVVEPSEKTSDEENIFSSSDGELVILIAPKKDAEGDQLSQNELVLPY